jgi:hypothetical protein
LALSDAETGVMKALAALFTAQSAWSKLRGEALDSAAVTDLPGGPGPRETELAT